MGIYKMPSLGADMESGTLREWEAKEGDNVKKGDIIAELETAKGVIDAEVFEDGVVEKILVKPNSELPVGAPMAIIRAKNEKLEDLEKELEKLQQEASMPKEEEKKEEVVQKKEEVAQPKQEENRIHITPLARKKAKELGVDINEVAKKIKGKISVEDVEKAAKEKNIVYTSPMRQAIAAAMSRSNAEIPHYYLSTKVNMTPALNWIKELNSKRSIKDRILPAALLIKAVAKALEKVPTLNGFWIDNTLQISKEINPGIAIALRDEGLITPALLNVQDMDLDETMKSLSDLIGRTRKKKLKSSEVTKQTITITNLGDLGVEEVFGVIYPPQVAIVGFGKIVDQPWIENDAIAIRKVVTLSLAADHRASDGRIGAMFLNKIDKLLQKPEELL